MLDFMLANFIRVENFVGIARTAIPDQAIHAESFAGHLFSIALIPTITMQRNVAPKTATHTELKTSTDETRMPTPIVAKNANTKSKSIFMFFALKEMSQDETRDHKHDSKNDSLPDVAIYFLSDAGDKLPKRFFHSVDRLQVCALGIWLILKIPNQR